MVDRNRLRDTWSAHRLYDPAAGGQTAFSWSARSMGMATSGLQGRDVVSRSAHASKLLTWINPSSQLKIDLRVATLRHRANQKSERVGSRSPADTSRHTTASGNQGKPRTAENTLQLQVKVNADAYISIVEVDSEGGVNLLFPMIRQPSFYPEGSRQGGETVLIPDSLLTPTRQLLLGLQSSEGHGHGSLFSSTDLGDGADDRQRIRNSRATASKATGKINSRALGESIDSIRGTLPNGAARGIIDL